MSQYKYYIERKPDYGFKSNHTYVNEERQEVAKLHRAARKFQKSNE